MSDMKPADLLSKAAVCAIACATVFCQRKLVASALKRTQLPIVLHVDTPLEQLHFPISHRLND